MASLKDARKALANTIQNTTGLRCYFNIPENPIIPCCVVQPDTSDMITFSGATNRFDRYIFTVEIIASSPSADAEQDWLDDALTGTGPTSVRQAIIDDQTLGTGKALTDASTAFGASVSGIIDYRKMQVGTETSLHWSGKLHVEVLTNGKV